MDFQSDAEIRGFDWERLWDLERCLLEAVRRGADGTESEKQGPHTAREVRERVRDDNFGGRVVAAGLKPCAGDSASETEFPCRRTAFGITGEERSLSLAGQAESLAPTHLGMNLLASRRLRG